MQRMRKLQVVLAILMLLLGLTFFNIKSVSASYNTPVQTATHESFAKMGTTTQYECIGPAAERDPQFYSALITSGSQSGGWVYQPDKIRIEVTGVYPDGSPLPGDRFRDLSILVSPDDSGVEQAILKIVFDVLVDILPLGPDAIVKNTKTVGGAITDRDAEKAWAEWCGFVSLHMEKGLRFGYELNVDWTLEGTYTINIHYLTEIWRHCREGGWYETTLHLYDTITYEYVNTPPAPSKPSGPTSGYRGVSYTYTTSTTDPNGDSLNYTFDWGDGYTTTVGPYTSGATASASHSWSSSGYKYIKVRAQDSTGAWSDWSPYLTVNIVNRAPNTPSKPSGTSGYVGVTYTYSTSTTDPDGDNVCYQFDWGDGSTTTTDYYNSGVKVYASHSWSTAGYKYIKVRAYDGYAWSGWSPSHMVSIGSDGGGGGCPMLYVYDGIEYFCEGLLDIHNPDGVDVVFEHTLVSMPQCVDGAYLMRLTEHPQTHSFIDQVKLYAVLEDGTVMELPLIWACHSEDGNVLPQLLHSDEWKADTLGADHNDGTSQSIDLKFAVLSPNLEIVGFVFQIEGNNAWEK